VTPNGDHVTLGIADEPAARHVTSALSRPDAEWLIDRLQAAVDLIPPPFPFQDGDLVEHLEYKDIYHVRNGKIHYTTAFDCDMSVPPEKFRRIGRLDP
jgi:hypothetical protein